MAWSRGPMPKDTFGFGGVVPFDAGPGTGFYFADFRGNEVTIISGGDTDDNKYRVLKPHEVAWYDNSLELPPKRE